MILLVVWSANIDSSALTSKVISNLLNDNTYDAFVRVIVLSIPTNSALIRKPLIYMMRKAFLEKVVVELVYEFDKKSYPNV